MRLSLETREVGRVTIVRCNGRIVAGDENECLRSHIAWLLRDRRAIVLHLGEVAFIDSSGLGTMVRTLTSVRQALRGPETMQRPRTCSRSPDHDKSG
jgi:anti-anti-sigma factor